MLLSVALMTMTMLGTALLPTHAQVGAAAGWLLFLLRCVMGFSVGGEYIAVVAYLLEGAPPNRRGLITSLASASSEIGGLLAVGVSYVDGYLPVLRSGWSLLKTPTASRPPISLEAEASEVIKPRRLGGAPSSGSATTAMYSPPTENPMTQRRRKRSQPAAAPT